MHRPIVNNNRFSRAIYDPAEDRRYDRPEYEPFQAAVGLDLPLSLHTATRRQGKIRGAGPGTLRDAAAVPPRRSIRRCRCAT